MSYRIGSFNCLNFGLGHNKDVQTFADIIANEHFDVIALQEIRRKDAVDMILRRLPNYWTGEADDEINDYAFIWNTKRLRLVETLTSTGPRKYWPRIYKQYRIDRAHGQKDLVRDPYFARFTPYGTPGGLRFEIRIINTHIRWNKSKDEAEDSVSANMMRKNEFDILARTIYAKEADKRYGNNMPAYTILLGDFNLNLPASGAKGPYLEAEIEIFENGLMTKRVITEQHELTTLKKPSETSDDSELGFASNYDHFSYDSDRFSSVRISHKRIDTVTNYCDGDFKRHKEKISDHVPIVMTLDLNK